MDRVLAIARREFIVTIRTKAFLLSVVIMPLIILGGAYAASAVEDLSKEHVLPLRRLGLSDPTGRVGSEFAEQIKIWNLQRPKQPFAFVWIPADSADEPALRAQIKAGELYGYFVVSKDAVDGDGTCTLVRRDTQVQTGLQLQQMLNDAIFAVRLRDAGVEPENYIHLRRPVPVREVDTETGQEVAGNQTARAVTPFGFMLVMVMGTMTISAGLLTSVIEEKSSRIAEVLLSAVSPRQLMAGKILGMALVGLLLIAVWLTAALYAARRFDAQELLSSQRLVMLLLYFVPGFLLLASMQAAIGAACNELKEAQTMNFPITLLTLVPMIFWGYITEYPASLASILLSYVPPITPFIMVLRLCTDPQTPAWQIVTTLAVLWGSVFAAMWAAAKIFRIGVLMYGKPPSLRELARWVRYA
jgi:ABC-2 type transport system permease protein